MRIVVSDLLGNLGGSHFRGFQQFFCLADTQRGQILGKGQAGLLCEHCGKMALGQVNLPRHILQHQVRIGVVFRKIGSRPADRRIAVTGTVPVAESDRALQQFRKLQESFLSLCVQRFLHLGIRKNIAGISVRLLDNPAGRHQAGYTQISQCQHGIHGTGILRQDRFHFFLRGILKALIQRAQLCFRQRRLLPRVFVDTDDLPLFICFRSLQMAGMPGVSHRLADIMEIRYRISH